MRLAIRSRLKERRNDPVVIEVHGSTDWDGSGDMLLTKVVGSSCDRGASCDPAPPPLGYEITPHGKMTCVAISARQAGVGIFANYLQRHRTPEVDPMTGLR